MISRAPRSSVVFDTYWRFAAERQQIMVRRLRGEAPPWTRDTVLQKYRFTNTFRFTDRVSQFLIRKVLYDKERSWTDTFFRILLFKTFNRIETWHLLESTLGELVYSQSMIGAITRALDRALQEGVQIYSAAYISPPGSRYFGHKEKHRNHLELLQKMMRDGLPGKVAAAKSMEEGYSLLIAFPTVGPFLAYQYITDINYSEFVDFSEMEFVVAGPGAWSGIKKCFPNATRHEAADLIRYVADRQEEEFLKRGLEFPMPFRRRLQLIDCQNLFCEVDKYSRVIHPDIGGAGGRKRIKQRFKPRSDVRACQLPPKWSEERAECAPMIDQPCILGHRR